MTRTCPLALAAALAVPLAACAPAVELGRAEPVSAAQWSRQADLPVEGEVAVPADLATLLNAPALAELTATAMAHSPDVRIAAARVDRAKALLGQARLAAMPQLSASLGVNGKAASGAALDFGPAFASLDATIDLDPFGRISGNRSAAGARLLSARHERDLAALAIETGLAQAWVLRATLARRIVLLDETIARAVEMERVVRARYQAGAATRVDLGQQTMRVLELRRKRTELVEALDQTRTAMAVLCGAEAPGFASAPTNIDNMRLPDLIPPPQQQLLAARPDVRAREASIAAANGDVRAARAAFFPVLRFSAQGLLESASGGLLNTTVTAGAAVLAPIFGRGRLTSDLKVAAADQVAAVEDYRLTVLGALAEVENLLSSIAASRERAELLDLILDEARLTANLSKSRYIEGEEELQIALDAEQLLGDAQDALVLGRQEQLFAQIAMYRAMGGYR